MNVRTRASVVVLLLGCFSTACGVGGGEAFAVPTSASEAPAWSPELSSPALGESAKKPGTTVQTALGVPVDADPSDDYLMDKGEYVLSYNHDRNVANWVSWKIDASDLGSTDRSNDFEEDDALPASFLHVTSKDYVKSGYDRGHLCPSGDRTNSATANTLTFLLTNIVPQMPALNRGPWKVFEEYSRSLVRSGDATAYVVAGSVFSASDSTIGRGVTVPAYTFKIVVSTPAGGGAAAVGTKTTPVAVMMPNDASVHSPWEDYLVSVDDVEAATGYDFLTALSVSLQRTIEAKVATP